jgi:MFS family permease
MKQLELDVNEDNYKDNPAQGAVINATPAQKSQNQGFLPVLKNRRFLILWGGQIFSQLADKVYLVLMIAIIASRFQSEEQTISGWVSAMMIAFTIPAILFGSLAGVYVDRWSKKTVLVATNLLRGGLVLAVPILLALTATLPPLLDLPVGFWVLLAITFAVSTLTQFFAPAEQAAIPLLVRNRNLLPANSLYTTTMMASLILGFAVGEPLLELTEVILGSVGIHWEFGKELVVGGAYVLAGLLLLLLRTKEKNLDTDESTHVWRDIWDGVRYLRKNHQVRNAMIQLVILFCIFAALAVLAVRLAEIIPGLKASQFGFLLAAGGVGMAGGAAFLGQWGQRFSNTQLSLWGSFGVAGALAGLSVFSQQLWIALSMTTVLGFFAALVGVPMQTIIQSQTPKAMRGKVFGLQNNAVNIALSLPLAVAGIAESFFGLQPVLLSLSAIALLGGLLTWYIAPTKSQ